MVATPTLLNYSAVPRAILFVRLQPLRAKPEAPYMRHYLWHFAAAQEHSSDPIDARLWLR
jgi:hypothetical protein